MSPGSIAGPAPTGIRDATGAPLETGVGVKRALAGGMVAGAFPFGSGADTGCSALTRCTGCQELAMTCGVNADDRTPGTGSSVTGPDPGAYAGVAVGA